MSLPRHSELPESPSDDDMDMILGVLDRFLRSKRPVTQKIAHEAQQLVYDAWEASDAEEETRLMLQALQLDPKNVDALLYIVAELELSHGEEIELLRKIVAAGEQRLGPKALKEYAGVFWGVVETRPYMRARERLAELLRAAGKLKEAIVEWNAMLQLNPNDNQGVRYAFLTTLLILGRLDRVRDLFKSYPNEFEFNVVFAWGKVLERFLSADLSGASKALVAARKQNPHMQTYLEKSRKLPKYLPEEYAPGSKEEAICFAEALRAAWKEHPAALKWLKTQK